MTDALSIIPADAMRQHRDDEFAPKLVEDERMAILACIEYGVLRDVVAKAFGINRRTVSHIANSGSTRYREVRKRRDEMGRDAFVAHYLTETVAQKIAANTKPRKIDTTPAVEKVSVHANGKAGIQVVNNDMLKAPHRVEIAFKADLEPKGWYYRDIDGPEHDTWFHNGEDSLRTSQACLKMVELNLTEL